MVKPYLDQVNGKVTDDVSTFSGGLNTYQDKGFLEETEMPYVMNMSMYKPPMLSTRQSRETLFQFFGGTYIGDILEIYAYNDSYIIGVADNHDAQTQYHIVVTARKTSPTNYVLYQYQIPSDWDRYYLCYARTQAHEYLYIVSNSGKRKLQLDPYNQGIETMIPIIDNHYGIPCWHKGRLFLADPTTNTITFSALNDFDNFDEFPDMSSPTMLTSDLALVDGTLPGLTTGAYNTGAHIITLNGEEVASTKVSFYYDATEKMFTFDTADRLVYKSNKWELNFPDYSIYAGQFFVTNAKGKITALRSFNDKLYIFCEHSIHVLYGSTPLTTSTEQFQLVDMNNNLGTLDDRYVAVGGGNIYWFGDDCQVYEHTGSYTHMISRPYSTRSGASYGGIDNILHRPYEDKYKIGKLAATSDKLYVNLSLTPNAKVNKYLFVYDIIRRIWWCEDGEFTTICNFSQDNNNILMCKENGDILRYSNLYTGYDSLYNFQDNKTEQIPIEYEFHTRVYGAEGADTRKTLSEVWFQAVSNADVYINDIWTSRDIWTNPQDLEEGYKKIGKLARVDRVPSLEKYNPQLYEQQRCIVERMYAERLNTFQIIVKGSGTSKFYQMKRLWRMS